MENCHHEQSCHAPGSRPDFLLIGCGVIIALSYLVYLFLSLPLSDYEALFTFSRSVFNLVNTMWWGVILGMVFVGLLDKMPRELVMSALGTKRGISGIMRATAAGTAFDLCSHGILLVGMKLYERGASTGQLMAFLIASPWSSFSLTLIMWALVGLPWTLCFIFLSMVIAVLSGLVFEKFEDMGILPANPNKIQLPKNFKFLPALKKEYKAMTFDAEFFFDVAKAGVKGSGMIIRWLLLGVILAALMRTFISVEHFHTFFGPTVAGLMVTMVMATILEVCSEGSTPIAADIMNRAHAPGNMFAFLMAGVATDYTEVMSIKETTRSWKIALFLPLVTLPQVLVLGYILNQF